jgi:hypothetical protein
MALSWFSGSEDVAGLVARKSFGKAAKVLRAQLERDPGNALLEIQLADVLALDGQAAEAVAILFRVADAWARDGFLAKAIALLKKVQRIDPGRAEEVDGKLADLAKARDEEALRRTAQLGSRLSRPRPAEAAEPHFIDEVPAPDAKEESFEVEIDLDGEEVAPAPPRPAEARLENTPLFSEFTGEELVDVIRGLRLLTFGSGEIVVAEGEPGDSLFVLTTGTVYAFCKDPHGRYRKVREMSEGSFFGEVSILTGSPRTATVTAATPVELLELDVAALDAIAARHPRVNVVLRDFCEARTGSVEEIRARMGRSGPPPPTEIG